MLKQGEYGLFFVSCLCVYSLFACSGQEALNQKLLEASDQKQPSPVPLASSSPLPSPLSSPSQTPAPAPDPYQLVLDEGRKAFREGRFEEAAKAFQKALDLKPDQDIPKHNLASSLGQLGRFEQALPLFLELEKKAPTDILLLRDLALIYSYQGDCDRAGTYYAKENKTIPRCPRSFEADQEFKLGDVAFKEGRYQDARTRYEKALALEPKYLDAKFNLASTFGALGDYPQAIKLYKEVETVKPDFPKLYEQLALSFSYQGDCPQAEIYYAKAGLPKAACPLQRGFRIDKAD
ncbi:MAG: tetratricopeptide repeat protein [Candidatus Sericytochromatia bacterium]